MGKGKFSKKLSESILSAILDKVLLSINDNDGRSFKKSTKNLKKKGIKVIHGINKKKNSK